MFTSSQEYEAARQELLKRYNEVAKGPARVQVMNVFLERVTTNVVKGLFEGLTAAQRQAEGLNKKVGELEAGAVKHRETVIGLEKDLEHQKRESASLSQDLKRSGDELRQEKERSLRTGQEIAEAKQRQAVLEGQIGSAKKEAEATAKSLQEAQRMAMEKDHEIRLLKEQIAQLESQLRSNSDRSSSESSKKDEKISQLLGENSELARQVHQKEQELVAVRKTAEDAQRRSEEQSRHASSAFSSDLAVVKAKYEEDLTRLEKDRQAVISNLHQVEAENGRLQV